MHMPGHKRNEALMQMINPYALDITEIEGFDNLHQAQGILKELSERISYLYGAGKSFPLVNGSTVGILAGMSACTDRGDRVLIARNCHKSVYHAMILKELIPVYCYPPKMEEFPVYGGICAEQIEKTLIKEKNIKLVVITSPTYEGIVSDIKAISEAVHRHGAFLLVDEAHGAHFGFHKGFPRSAVRSGADIVIQSLHKTLPAFTQSAVLHSNNDNLNKKIEQYLSIYESSSPSYLLMAGIDRCISMLEDQADSLFDNYYERLTEFYKAMGDLKNLELLKNNQIGKYNIFDIDASKITVSVMNAQITGHVLQTLLREKYHIIMEMEAPEYVLGMTSICDTEDGFTRMAEALLAIDKALVTVHQTECRKKHLSVMPVMELSPGQAAESESEQVLIGNSIGRVSAAFVCMYPPGSPLLVPGEKIEEDMLDYIKWLKIEGITISGLIGENNDEIEVVRDTF
jgi:arginine/lysine/ornithine decarboxylase